MSSAQWRKRRDLYFKTHDKVCAACKADGYIHLHHLNYDHFGAERDIDLLPLCYACHKQVHYIQKTEKISIAAATKLWVRIRKNPSYGKKSRKKGSPKTVKRRNPHSRQTKSRSRKSPGRNRRTSSSVQKSRPKR